MDKWPWRGRQQNVSTCRRCSECRDLYCPRPDRRQGFGCHFVWSISQPCPGPSRNTVMVGYGTRRHFHYYHINSICQEYEEKLFHAFSGSYVMSQFSSKGKDSVWKWWKTSGSHSSIMCVSARHHKRWTTFNKIYFQWGLRWWRSFLQLRVHCFNTQVDAYTKPVFGETVWSLS